MSFALLWSSAFFLSAMLGFGQAIDQSSKEASGLLLLPGTYFPEEVPATNGEKWLTLFRHKRNLYNLAYSRIQIAKRKPFPSDGVPDCNTLVSVQQKSGTAICMMKGIPGLAPGRVKTVLSNGGLQPNIPIHLALSSDASYELVLACNQPNDKIQHEEIPASLLLKNGRSTQVLFSTVVLFHSGKFDCVGNEGTIVLIWAGDLNGDGLIDLLIDLQDHYCIQHPALFISSTVNVTNLDSVVTRFSAIRSGTESAQPPEKRQDSWHSALQRLSTA